MTKTKLIGLDNLIKDFENLSKDLGYDAIVPVLVKNGEPMAQAMKGMVRENTGRLANSIKVVTPQKKFGIGVIIGPEFKRDGAGTLTLNALAAINEYGAGERKPRRAESKKVLIDGKWRTMSQDKPFAAIPAKPFIRPAFDMTKEKVGEGIVKDLMRLVDDKAKKNNLKTKI